MIEFLTKHGLFPAASKPAMEMVWVVESVDPNEPAKVKREPTEHFVTEILTTEAAQDEMAGLAQALKKEQDHHELARVSLSHYLMGAACNVKRHLNLLAFQMRRAALNPA